MPEPTSLKEAAIIIKSLPKQHAEKVMARLDGESKRRLHSTMAQSSQITAFDVHGAVEHLLEDSENEFVVVRQDEKNSSKRWKGEYERRKTDRTTAAGSHTADRRKKKSPSPFDFLDKLDLDLVVRLLKVEHPKSIAQVIATLDPTMASMIMRGFEMPLRMSVMRRLCEIEELDPVALMELRYSLKMRANKVGMIQHYSRKGVDVASELLSLSDERTRKSLLAYMNQTDPELKEILELKTLSIHDIGLLTEEETKSLLRRVDTTAWAPALRGTTLSVQQKVLRNMAPAAAEILSGEMAEIDPLDEEQIENAAQAVLKAIWELKKRGVITTLDQKIAGEPSDE